MTIFFHVPLTMGKPIQYADYYHSGATLKSNTQTPSVRVLQIALNYIVEPQFPGDL